MIEKQNTKDIFISCCFLCAVGDFRVNTHLIKNTKAATFTGQGVPRATGHRELFFFWILLQDISLGCHYGLLLDLPISAWMRKKIFFPNGQFRSPLNSTTWKNLKVKLYLVKLIWGGGWPRSSEIFHSYFSPLSSSDQMEPVTLSEYLLPLNLYIILSNTVH